MPLLRDAIAELDQWTLGPPKSKSGLMQIRSITGTSGWPSVQLLPRERLGEIRLPFEPSVYRGAGCEPRKGIVFSVPADVLNDLRTIENWAKVDSGPLWHSAMKEPGDYAGSVKAKINVSGPSPCIFVDMNGKPVPMPDNWIGLRAIPIIEIRGVYIQKTGSGLILDVTHLMIGETEVLAHEFL